MYKYIKNKQNHIKSIHLISTRSLLLQSPNKYSSRIIKTSLNILTDASITFNSFSSVSVGK